jgi:hypothetical protein
VTASSPNAAADLAELDARYDAHLTALRGHALLAHEAVEAGAGELAERLDPEPT